LEKTVNKRSSSRNSSGNHVLEDQRDDLRKLDQNVQLGAGGILQWIPHGITRNLVLMRLTTLLVLGAELPGFNVLLCVIPLSPRIAHGNLKLDTGSQLTLQQASNLLLPANITLDQGTENHQELRLYHFFQTLLGADADAGLVVGLLTLFENQGELPHALLHHVVLLDTHALHSKRGKSVGEHLTYQDPAELLLVVNVNRVETLPDLELGLQLEGNQLLTANRKTLPDLLRGVPLLIQLVRQLPGVLAEAGHLLDPALVVGDRSILVDRQTQGQSGEHTELLQGNTEHTRAQVLVVDRGLQHDNRHNTGLVTQL